MNCADPGYVPIYETDSDKEKTDKLRWNLMGADNGYEHEAYEALYELGTDPHIYFASEADFLARVALEKEAKAALDAAWAEGYNPDGGILADLTEEQAATLFD